MIASCALVRQPSASRGLFPANWPAQGSGVEKTQPSISLLQRAESLKCFGCNRVQTERVDNVPIWMIKTKGLQKQGNEWRDKAKGTVMQTQQYNYL